MNKPHITEMFGIEIGTWVWCLHCERCYKVGEHRTLKDGTQMCHYLKCNGDAVLDVQEWSALKESLGVGQEIPERGKVYSLGD